MKKRLGFDLIILGAPAAGKDTQAKLLQRKFALKPVESGKYLRGLVKNKTKLGSLLSNNFTKGLPAPVEIIKEFIESNFRFLPKHQDLIFVGNPRLVQEAQFLVKQLNKHKRDFFVLCLTLPLKEIEARSYKRMRNDDDKDYVKQRISWHKQQVSKTVNYFRKFKKLQFVNGNQSIKEVNDDILKAINDYKRSKTSRAPEEIW